MAEADQGEADQTEPRLLEELIHESTASGSGTLSSIVSDADFTSSYGSVDGGRVRLSLGKREMLAALADGHPDVLLNQAAEVLRRAMQILGTQVDHDLAFTPVVASLGDTAGDERRWEIGVAWERNASCKGTVIMKHQEQIVELATSISSLSASESMSKISAWGEDQRNRMSSATEHYVLWLMSQMTVLFDKIEKQAQATEILSIASETATFIAKHEKPEPIGRAWASYDGRVLIELSQGASVVRDGEVGFSS